MQLNIDVLETLWEKCEIGKNMLNKLLVESS